MHNRVQPSTSEEDAPNAELDTELLKATLPSDLAEYARQLVHDLGCSSMSSLAEAFLRAHRARPVEGLAVQVAKAEARIAAKKKQRSRANIATARESRWPARKLDHTNE